MRRITIAVKRPNEDWKVKEVEDTLKSYQAIVGGYIEPFDSTESGIHFFCNEEGKLRNLKPNVLRINGEMIVGTIFAVRADEEGEFQSLTEQDITELSEL